MLLALDTATRYLNFALHDGQTIIIEQAWRTGNRHNTLLSTAIQQALTYCDVTMNDITAVAVATGPGSYTGLRIGIALAKGLAAVRNLPLIGVPTLDILASAQAFPNTRHHLLAVVQAGRSRIIAGEYRVKKGRWSAEGEAYSTTWTNLLEKIEVSTYITGEVDAEGQQAIEAAKAKDVSITLINPAERLRRAGYLAQEAWRLLQESSPEAFPPAHVLPIYAHSD